MSQAALESIVREKEARSAQYHERAAYWLLVVVEPMDAAQEQEIRIDGLNIASDVFEKIIVYKPGFEHIVEADLETPPPSPRRRLGEASVPVAHPRRKLRSLKGAGADLLDKVNMRQQRAAWFFVRVEDADFLAELVAHDFNWLEEIGIVRDDDRDFEPSHVCVVKQVARFTSEPFSSVLMTCTYSCRRPGTGTRGMVISCERKCP